MLQASAVKEHIGRGGGGFEFEIVQPQLIQLITIFKHAFHGGDIRWNKILGSQNQGSESSDGLQFVAIAKHIVHGGDKRCFPFVYVHTGE